MTNLLCRIFLKKYQNSPIEQARQKYGTFASLVGIFINIFLFTVKFIAGTLSASVSITADAINNLSDAGSSIISLISFKISSKPADRGHPFGHARFEYVASMAVAFIILMIAIELFKSSFDKILSPTPTVFSFLAIAILVLSILLKLWLFIFYRTIGKKIDSTVIIASSADSLSDVVSTGAVLISLLITRMTGFDLDGYIGLAVAVFIAISGIRILNDTKNHILGMAPDQEMVNKIYEHVKLSSDILGVHDLVIHNYGPGRCFASMHLEVNGNENIFKSHDIIDNIEKSIHNDLGVQCVVHMDPIQTDDEVVSHLRSVVSNCVSQIDSRLSIHDFRMVPGTTHTNLIFDITVPFELKLSDDEVEKIVTDELQKISPKYCPVMTIDKQ